MFYHRFKKSVIKSNKIINLLEQWSLTGGRFNSFAMSLFFIMAAWSIWNRSHIRQWRTEAALQKWLFFILIYIYHHTDLFLIHSVANDDDAIADPHPKVLNFASIIFPLSSTSICSFITSPHAGAPTRPVPTFFFLASSFPTFRGFS